MGNEALIRHLYSVAEVKDFKGFVELFTEDGTFTDESIGVTCRGKEIARTGEIYATAFPDMHRELFNVYLSGDDMVVVQLALQGTHNGPLQLPMGTISATASGWMLHAAMSFSSEVKGSRGATAIPLSL